MGSKFQLIYEGPVDNSPETIDKLKALFSEAETKIQSVEHAPCIIETSASEAELKALFEKIAEAGGKVKIEELIEDSSLSVDNNELWQEENGPNKDNLVAAEEVEPLEFVLDDDTEPDTVDDDAPLFTEEQLKEDLPQKTDESELEFSLELSEPTDTQELVDELVPDEVEEEVGELLPEEPSEELGFSFEETEAADEEPKPAKEKTSDVEDSATEDLGLSFDAEEPASDKEVKKQPENPVDTGVELSEEKKEAKQEPDKQEALKQEKSEEPQVSLADLTKKTLDVTSIEDIEDEDDYVEEVAEEEDSEEIVAKSSSPASKKKTDQKQLVVLGVVLLILVNVLYFTFFSSAPKEPTLDLSAMSQVSAAPVEPAAANEEVTEEKVEVLQDYVVNLESDTVTMEGKFTLLENEFVKTSAKITTPQPPERSAKDKAFGIKPTPWIRKIEIDRLKLKVNEEGKVAGTGRARAYIIQDPDRMRVVSVAKVSGVLVDDVLEASVLISNHETVGEPELVEILEIKNKNEDSFELKVQVPFTAYLTESTDSSD